jgi:hypothetical protein
MHELAQHTKADDTHYPRHELYAAVIRKNSIQLPSDRDVGTYLFGLRDLENPGSQLGWQKIPSA